MYILHAIFGLGVSPREDSQTTFSLGRSLILKRLLRFFVHALLIPVVGSFALPLFLEVRAAASLEGGVHLCNWSICEKAPPLGDEWRYWCAAVVLSGLFLFHFAVASFAEPGFVQGGCYGDSSGRHDTTGCFPVVLPLKNERDKIWARDQGPKYAARWCSSCQTWKPPRAQHCDTLGHCVHRLSHYSGLIENAVGGGNIGHFLLMIIYGNLGLLYGLVLDLTCLVQIWSKLNMVWWSRTPNGTLLQYVFPSKTHILESHVLLLLVHLSLTLIGLIVFGPQACHVFWASSGESQKAAPWGEERIIPKQKAPCTRPSLFVIHEDPSTPFQDWGAEASKAFILQTKAYSRDLAGNLSVVLGLGLHLVLPMRFRMAPIQIHSPRLSQDCMDGLKAHLDAVKRFDEKSSIVDQRRSKQTLPLSR
jgi:hypothetical protein